MKRLSMTLLMLLLVLAVPAQANSSQKQQKKKTKSVSKLTKQYVNHVKKQVQGKEQLAKKKSSDPATVTREKNDTVKDNHPKTFQEEYERFRQQVHSDYENFRDRANKEYAAFVREAWEQHQVMPAIPQPKEEEVPPVIIPEEDKKKPIEDKPVPIKEEVVVLPPPEPQPVPIAPIKEQPKPLERYLDLKIYGTGIKVRFNDDEKFKLSACTPNAVADAWEKMSGKAYHNTIRDCLVIRMGLNLSDWAYLQMLQTVTEACLGKTNEATLLMAYIYCQTGYQMRIGIYNGKLFLLYSSKHTIYDKLYFKVDGEQYYVWGSDEQRMEICKVGFPEEKPLSLYIPMQQKFMYRMSQQRLLKSKRYPDLSVNVSVNQNLVDFYNSYPTSMVNDDFMTRWAMYANTPMDSKISEGLYPALKGKISGLGQKESMERLLNFVQTAFVYEYDNKVWGHDRAFFAEETLFYPYCDCEDRSILLSRLVRDLLNLKVILVFYPGHLAMAVHFDEDVKGDYIMLNGTKYVICDPTYIGARVGQTMPGMDNKTATVILLNN